MTEGFVSNWLWQNCQLERTIFGRSDRLVLNWIEKAIFITQRHDSLSFLVYDWFWHWIWMIIIFWLGYPWPTKPSAVILSYPSTSFFFLQKKIQLWTLRHPIEADMRADDKWIQIQNTKETEAKNNNSKHVIPSPSSSLSVPSLFPKSHWAHPSPSKSCSFSSGYIWHMSRVRAAHCRLR